MIEDSFLLDYRTLALKPVFGEYLSEIITLEGTYYSKVGPIELLNNACLRHHSSKEGRKEAAKKLLNFKKKPPFLISDDVGVFPTTSSKNPECIYIFNHFFKSEPASRKETKITFNNKESIIVPVSFHTVKQQKSRLHMLMSHVQQTKRQYIPGQHFFMPWKDDKLSDQL